MDLWKTLLPLFVLCSIWIFALIIVGVQTLRRKFKLRVRPSPFFPLSLLNLSMHLIETTIRCTLVLFVWYHNNLHFSPCPFKRIQIPASCVYAERSNFFVSYYTNCWSSSFLDCFIYGYSRLSWYSCKANGREEAVAIKTKWGWRLGYRSYKMYVINRATWRNSSNIVFCMPFMTNFLYIRRCCNVNINSYRTPLAIGYYFYVIP